jgi:acyl-coenzyme A thioesterase PaaI-like protein
VTVYRTDHPVRPLIDHNCFGCGALNPIGLHLRFYALDDGEGVWAPWMPTSEYEGYGGMIHGGIISTLMDEILAWSLYARDTWAVTARLNTTFRKPVRIGESVRLVGRIVRDRGRLIELHGEIRRESDDALLAESEATFMRVPPEQAERWNRQYLTVKE